MGHIPLGYRIEAGKAVLDEDASKQVKELFVGYLSGLSLTGAAKSACIKRCHASVGKILENKRYLGDEFYPKLIDRGGF